MSAEHSPTPWSEDPEGEVAVTLEDANGKPICDVYLEEHGEANAKRIVDCINACAGINPKAIPEMLLALQDIAESDNKKSMQIVATIAVSKAVGTFRKDAGPFEFPLGRVKA